MCGNQRPLEQQLDGLRMKLVKKPEVLLDMSPSTVRPLEPHIEAPGRWRRGVPLSVRLGEYKAMHRRAVREGLEGAKVLATCAARALEVALVSFIEGNQRGVVAAIDIYEFMNVKNPQ